jgi:hypothetical protein
MAPKAGSPLVADAPAAVQCAGWPAVAVSSPSIEPAAARLRRTQVERLEIRLSGERTMRLSRIFACVGMLVAISAPATAEENVTVQSLLNQDFTVVSTITTHVGSGLFLQKKDQLFVCFVVETQQSLTLNTLYCKPVH